MVSPPEAEPVSAASILVATASDTSGPPPIDSTQSRTTANAGMRRHHGAEADQARHAQHRQHRGVGAGVHGRAQRRQPPIVDREQRHDRAAQRHDHRPHAADGGERGRAPARLGEKARVECAAARTTTSARLTTTTTTSGSAASRIGGGSSARRAVRDLGRIELARGGGALAHDSFVARRAVGRHRRAVAKALAGAARRGFGAARATTGRSPA